MLRMTGKPFKPFFYLVHKLMSKYGTLMFIPVKNALNITNSF